MLLPRYPAFDTTYLIWIQIVIYLFIINYTLLFGAGRSMAFMGIIESYDSNATLFMNRYEEREISEQEKRAFQEIADEISDYLSQNKTFLNAELSLRKFSDELGKDSRLVSQAINEIFNTNFSDYINSYRLEYAKEQLIKATNAEKNVSQILYESGFNSKTSFYNYFKKKTGLSPKDFRAKHQMEENENSLEQNTF